jgi:DNA repair exonuclease SbcCD nuclease subunit
MAKFMLFSDIHVHPHKKSQDRLNDCIKALEWVFEVAKEQKVDAVLFGGDLLHDRQKIDSLTYNQIFNVLEKQQNENFKTYLLLGNHDLWFATSHSVSSVRPFKALKNFEVIDSTQAKTICGVSWHFIPYTHHPIEELEKLRDEINNSYLLGHLAIDGAKLNSAGSISDVIIEHDGDMVVIGKDLFHQYKRAFFGHYHSWQKLTETIEYIGSPLQLSFGEAGEKKHVIILDSADNSLTYVENTFSPKHIYVKDTEISSLTESDLKNNFVCILTEESNQFDDKKNMNRVIEELKASSVQVKKQNKKADVHAITDAKLLVADQDKLLERYVEQVQNVDLSKEKLLQVGLEIVRKAQDEKD